MSIFHKPRPAHQLVDKQDDQGQLRYRCSVCTRTFYSAEYATRKGEYCCGKRCYTQWNWPNPADPDRETIPPYLMHLDELKATGRKIRKHQVPLAYFHNELIARLDGHFTGYDALYDVRECSELVGAVVLPDLGG